MAEKIARFFRTPLLEQRSLRALGFPRKPVLLVGELVPVAIGMVHHAPAGTLMSDGWC